MDSLEQYRAKADRCRRLARMINDRQAIEGLTALATEFDAEVAALEAAWMKTGRQPVACLPEEKPAH
ncbi:MAG TPA: hypothetical protein VGD08_02195 [Stellaceae bacterium]|jgi:hypothetical protein